MPGQSERQLVNLLKVAYSAELAAAYAYRGHWHSVRDPAEKIRIRKIEEEEWHHRRLVGEMLATLNARHSRPKEVRAVILGRVLGVLCHVSGWLAPMYGAGRLESRNIREYETAARHARDSGQESFIECLFTMAEVEWEHEYYFRSRVAIHRWAPQLPIWLQPPPRESIRLSFENESRLKQTSDGAGV